MTDTLRNLPPAVAAIGLGIWVAAEWVAMRGRRRLGLALGTLAALVAAAAMAACEIGGE